MRFAKIKEIESGTYQVQSIVKSVTVPFEKDLIEIPQDINDEQILNHLFTIGDWFMSSQWAAVSTNQRGAVIHSNDEVLWNGHAYDYSGYAKANRELLFRISNSIKVQFFEDPRTQELKIIESQLQSKLDNLKKNFVSPKAPFIKFYTPQAESMNRHRICFTMMETWRVHKDFVARLNRFYDEVWTPTQWNMRTFQESGVKIPISVIPLGIDPNIYNPTGLHYKPLCITIDNKKERPEGFKFISVFQPTFRKRIDFLLESFEKAFQNNKNVCLILASTAHSSEEVIKLIKKYIKTTRVYILEGKYTELQMAGIYRSCHVFVSTSLGEGWNLPMCEAAACGLPVIVPNNTGHQDFVDHPSLGPTGRTFIFNDEGTALVPGSEKVCHWYDKMPFSYFGEKSQEELIFNLRLLEKHYEGLLPESKLFSNRIRSLYTWDRASNVILSHIRSL